jgi:hypothetical protein
LKLAFSGKSVVELSQLELVTGLFSVRRVSWLSPAIVVELSQLELVTGLLSVRRVSVSLQVRLSRASWTQPDFELLCSGSSFNGIKFSSWNARWS